MGDKHKFGYNSFTEGKSKPNGVPQTVVTKLERVTFSISSEVNLAANASRGIYYESFTSSRGWCMGIFVLRIDIFLDIFQGEIVCLGSR